jgi:hypothetical protein
MGVVDAFLQHEADRNRIRAASHSPPSRPLNHYDSKTSASPPRSISGFSCKTALNSEL